MDWQAIVKTVAPWIGGALGGPMGAAALSEVAAVVLPADHSALQAGTPAAKVESAISAVLADPQKQAELLAKIKGRDQAFEVKMTELGFHLEDLAVADTQGARDLQRATKSRMVPGLAALAVGGFLAMGGYMIFHGVMGMDAATTSIFMYILAKLDSKVEQVYHFFFGTSSGSEKKTDILAQQAQG